MKKLWHSIYHFGERHEKRLSIGAFLTGFIVDNLTLTRIDLFSNDGVLLLYLLAAGACIVVMYLHTKGRLAYAFVSKSVPWLPLALQFSFGALFSGFFVFYTRSGSLAGSWLFVLIVTGMLVGNEFLRDRYLRFEVQTSIFFLALFSFMIFFVPVMIDTMGALVFVASGLFSLALMALFLWGLSRVARHRFVHHDKRAFGGVVGIFVLMNILYFANIIPPVPLSLKSAGVYHSIVKTGATYIGTYEPSPWYDLFHDQSTTYQYVSGTAVYVFSAIFAPARLDTTIVHQWQKYDPGALRWVTQSTIPFSITGGRTQGYRGYTYKSDMTPGSWRVNVETARGQLLGRVSFEIIEASSTPPLATQALQ